MDSIGEFLNMGGYAGFVWPCYIAAAVVLAVLAAVSLRGLKAAQADLDRLENDADGAERP